MGDRLIDDLRKIQRLTRPRLVAKSKTEAWLEYSAGLRQFWQSPDLPVAEIPGVAAYYFEGSPESWSLTRDFPDLTPPFPVLWFEYPFPQKIHSELGDRDDLAHLCPNGRAGVLILSVPPEDAVVDNVPAGTKWILACDVFLDYGLRGGEIEGPHGCQALAIDDDGKIIEHPWIQSFVAKGDQEAAEIMRLMITWIHPPLIALSMLPRTLPESMTEIHL